MASRQIRLFKASPGLRNLRPLLADFASKGYGIVTATSDAALPALRAALPEEVELDVEPFGSFIQGLLARLNSSCGGLVHSGHYIAAIAAACRESQSGSIFYASRRFPGTHRRIGACLKELAGYGVRLNESYETLAPELQRKLAELAEIEDKTLSSLRALGKEAHAQHLDLLLSLSADGSLLPDRVFVVMDGDASPRQLEALKWLAKLGTAVTALVPTHDENVPGVFEGVSSRLAFLGEEPKKSGSGNSLAKNLFAGCASDPGFSPHVVAQSFPDSLSECEHILSQVKAALDAGRSPSTVAIYARNLEAYAPLLAATALRLDVPLSCPRRIRLLNNAFARITLQLMEACAGVDVRALELLTRISSPSIASLPKVEFIETLREAHRMRAGAWPYVSEWSLNGGEGREWLSGILRWRDEVVGSVLPREEWLGSLRKLLPLLPSAGDADNLARDHRASSVMQRTLGEVVTLARLNESEPVRFGDFVGLCRETWENADVSLPIRENGVLVAASAEQIGDRDQLFVLGMVEGVFPRRRREDPILSDAEREQISRAANLPLALPTSQAQASAERDEFYRLCCCPEKELTLSFPRAGEDRESVASFYFLEIERVAGASVEPLPRPVLSRGLDRSRAVGAVISEPLREALMAEEDPADFSPTELRVALQCGFQHFARHRLKLRKDDFTSHWHHLRHLPQRTGLVGAQSPQVSEQRLESALSEELEKMYGDVPGWELPLLEAGGKRMIAEWVGRELAVREKWPREDSTRQTGVGFGNGLRADLGKGITIRGSVSGTSTLGRYAVVHLIESRSPNIAFEGGLDDADALYYGLYLLSICQQNIGAAVEVESMDGKRTLMVVPYLDKTMLPSSTLESLQFVRVAGDGDPYEAKKAFYERVRELMKKAVHRIRDVEVTPRPGDHCQWCEYGELCRLSNEFGEAVSPF